VDTDPAPPGSPLVAPTGSTRTGPPQFDTEATSGPLEITDVLSEDISVAGADAPGMIIPDIQGRDITLTIKGKGFNRQSAGYEANHPHADDDDEDDDWVGTDEADWRGLKVSERIAKRFTPPTVMGFWAFTEVQEHPGRRVYLDNMIAMTPSKAPDTVFRNDTLTMTLNTRGIVDFQLQGLHPVVVKINKNWVRVPIRFGSPAASPGSLAPAITSAKLIKTGKTHFVDTNKWMIELQGRNLPLDFRKVYCKLGNERTYYRATFLASKTSVGYLHVPEKYKLPAGGDTLTLITPFGMTFAAVK
jgi:hypothetical protein